MKPLSRSITAKIPYGKNSVRRKFHTAIIPYGENSVRRKFRTAKIPYGEKSYGEKSYGENSYDEKSGHEKKGRREAFEYNLSEVSAEKRKDGVVCVLEDFNGGVRRSDVKWCSHCVWDDKSR